MPNPEKLNQYMKIPKIQTKYRETMESEFFE